MGSTQLSNFSVLIFCDSLSITLPNRVWEVVSASLHSASFSFSLGTSELCYSDPLCRFNFCMYSAVRGIGGVGLLFGPLYGFSKFGFLSFDFCFLAADYSSPNCSSKSCESCSDVVPGARFRD